MGDPGNIRSSPEPIAPVQMNPTVASIIHAPDTRFAGAAASRSADLASTISGVARDSEGFSLRARLGRLVEAGCDQLPRPGSGITLARWRALAEVASISLDAVFTTWRHDGLPDHEAVGRAVAKACQEVSALFFEVPIWMWHWATPGDERVPWPALVSIPLSEGSVTSKCAAIAAHASQLTSAPDLASPPILGRSALRRCRRRWEAVFP